MGIERELLQFVARGLAVAAEQRHQRRARVRRDAQVRSAHFVVDQFCQIALAVGIAADRDRGLGALAGLAQRRFRAQLAGLDHDAAIFYRHLAQRIDAGGKTARAGAHANGAASAEHRNRHRLLDQPRRLGGEFVAVHPHQRKRIGGIIDRRGHQRVGALAHQARVGTVQQDDGTRRIRLVEECVDVPSAQRDHVRPFVPRTRRSAQLFKRCVQAGVQLAASIGGSGSAEPHEECRTRPGRRFSCPP